NSRGSTLSTQDPITKAALLCLQATWPQAVPFDELVNRANQHLAKAGMAIPDHGPELQAEQQRLGSALLTAFCGGLCELPAHPGCFVLNSGERPEACPLARLQASQGLAVINRRHERVELD